MRLQLVTSDPRSGCMIEPMGLETPVILATAHRPAHVPIIAGSTRQRLYADKETCHKERHSLPPSIERKFSRHAMYGFRVHSAAAGSLQALLKPLAQPTSLPC